jgi:hypothetical protein
MKRPNWLTILLEKGSVGHSAANRKILNELITLEIVGIKTAGTRRTVIVNNPSQLTQWLRVRYPQHAIDPETLPTRQGNIIRSGSSKIGKRSHDVLPFHFKWFGCDSDPFSRLSKAYGMAAVFTDRMVDLPIPAKWRLLTIENWEPFYRADYTGAPVAVMVAYLGGNVSDILINSLKTFSSSPERILHFGDYDWEGLYIFQRLLKAVPSAQLYIPENVETLFKQYGRRKFLEKQKRKAAFDMTNSSCLPVIKLIEQYNAGLEQEIVELPETI